MTISLVRIATSLLQPMSAARRGFLASTDLRCADDNRLSDLHLKPRVDQLARLHQRNLPIELLPAHCDPFLGGRYFFIASRSTLSSTSVCSCARLREARFCRAAT